jgi:hypothetical protein
LQKQRWTTNEFRAFSDTRMFCVILLFKSGNLVSETDLIVGKKKKTLSFFAIVAIIGLAAVLIGFAKTFIIPTAEGTFKAPIIIHIHGAFAFAWILLFLLQTFLIHYNKYSTHRTIGIFGLLIALGVTITLIFVGKYVVTRDLSQGLGDFSYSNLPGVITSAFIFFTLVLSGILTRKNSPTHKRLMLLATIVVLWPAWFRFRHYFPSIPRPDIWFALVLADSLIVIAWIWDKTKNDKIHPVLKWAGLFIILEQSFEVLAFDSSIWRSVGKWIYYVI